jgi:hypothetical protein
VEGPAGLKLFTLDEDSNCMKTCGAEDGSRIDHGAAEQRVRFAKLTPTDDGETCESLKEVQTRDCSDGVFSSWASAGNFNHTTCTERCETPDAYGIGVPR